MDISYDIMRAGLYGATRPDRRSGLDATSSFALVKTLRAVAEQGVTVAVRRLPTNDQTSNSRDKFDSIASLAFGIAVGLRDEYYTVSSHGARCIFVRVRAGSCCVVSFACFCVRYRRCCTSRATRCSSFSTTSRPGYPASPDATMS